MGYVDGNGDPIPASAFENDHEVRPLTAEQQESVAKMVEALRKPKPE